MRTLALALLAGLAVAWVAPPAAAQQATQPALPQAEVERIVREYLLREPEVVYQALTELQRRQEVAQVETRRKLVAEHHETIFAAKGDAVGGNAEGDVTLVEFFDYRCGYCRTMAQGLRSLIDQDSKLRFVFKEMPILSPESTIAAKAAMAAAKQGKYAELHFALMQAKELDAASIMELARKNGLDPQRLAADMEDPRSPRRSRRTCASPRRWASTARRPS
jgi:protein-disulfide isomerase